MPADSPTRVQITADINDLTSETRVRDAARDVIFASMADTSSRSRAGTLVYEPWLTGVTVSLAKFLSEEKAYFVMKSILEDVLTRRFFSHGYRAQSFTLQRLMQRLLPDLYFFFRKKEYLPMVVQCAREWFRSLFQNGYLQAEASYRILDCLFHEGQDVLLRAALAIMFMKKRAILSATSREQVKEILIKPDVDENLMYWMYSGWLDENPHHGWLAHVHMIHTEMWGLVEREDQVNRSRCAHSKALREARERDTLPDGGSASDSEETVGSEPSRSDLDGRHTPERDRYLDVEEID